MEILIQIFLDLPCGRGGGRFPCLIYNATTTKSLAGSIGNMEPAMNRRVAHRKGRVRCIIKDLPL